MRATWRDYYRPLIAAVLTANEGKSLNEKRQALRKAFPSGPRQYHPYKIWLDECRVQLGLKRPKVKQKGIPLPIEPAAGQLELF